MNNEVKRNIAKMAKATGIDPAKMNEFTTMDDIMRMENGEEVPMRTHDARYDEYKDTMPEWYEKHFGKGEA